MLEDRLEDLAVGGRHLGAVVGGERGLRPDGVELQIHDRIDEQRMHRVPGRAAHETVEGDVVQARVDTVADDVGALLERDRKSTRLNSSHLGISYAVFCLKKKKQ